MFDPDFFELDSPSDWTSILARLIFTFTVPIVVTIRCCKYRPAGTSNLRASRPRSYKIKMLLQTIMCLVSLALGVLFSFY